MSRKHRLRALERAHVRQNPPPFVPPLRVITERPCRDVQTWITACMRRTSSGMALVARVFYDPDREAIEAALDAALLAELKREPLPTSVTPIVPAAVETPPIAPEPVTDVQTAPPADPYEYMRGMTREQLTLRGFEPMPSAERVALEAEINGRIAAERNPPRVDPVELEARLRRGIH